VFGLSARNHPDEKQGKAIVKLLMLFLVIVGILTIASVVVIAVIETRRMEKDKRNSC